MTVNPVIIKIRHLNGDNLSYMNIGPGASYILLPRLGYLTVSTYCAYLDSSYFFDHLSDSSTDRMSATSIKNRLRTFKVVIPQAVIGEVLTVLIRDNNNDTVSLELKIRTLAKELTALIDVKNCLPVTESKHIVHLRHFMDNCNFTPTDSILLSMVIGDPDSDYLVTSDQVLIKSNLIYEYEGKIRNEGKRNRILNITDSP